MVAIADIKDEKSFRAWLEETNLPREACIALAARAALRVLPLAVNSAVRIGWYSPLIPLRANLIASAVCKHSAELSQDDRFETLRHWAGVASEDAREASEYAFNACPEYPSSALNALDAAGHAAAAGTASPVFEAIPNVSEAAHLTAHAYGCFANGEAHDAAVTSDRADADAQAAEAEARAAAWAFVRSDCEILLKSWEALDRAPLFADTLPKWHSDRHFDIGSELSSAWSFWLGWYERALKGEPQPWPLLLEVATQPDEFWRGTDAEINGRIAEIVARHPYASMIRHIHHDVYNSCAEFLQSDNYFHAVHEAIKSIFEKLRRLTGLGTDGATLVDASLCGETPLLAINERRSVSDTSEQKGFGNLIKGTSGMFRNPTAHNTHANSEISKEDAEALLSLASLIHRRLDRSRRLDKM